MYPKFSEYKEARELFDFNSKLVCLYEQILQSEMSFDDWWEKKGLPVILENAYSNEEELLMEFMGGVGNWIGRTGANFVQGARDFGAGLKQGWQQGQQGQQGQNNAPAPNNSDFATLKQNVLSVHEQLMQKLQELQKASGFYPSQSMQNLMQQMQSLPNVIKNMEAPTPQNNTTPDPYGWNQNKGGSIPNPYGWTS